MTLTEKQRQALATIARHQDGVASWFFGSTTVSVLRKRGLVENYKPDRENRLRITAAGRTALGRTT